jgi:type IV pilus assembly protein PilF
LTNATVSDATDNRNQQREESLDTYLKLGFGYLRERNSRGARLYLQKALALEPKSAAAHNGMALLYQYEKDVELAEEHYIKALGYDPEHTSTRNNYGVFLTQSGKYQKGYEQFTIAAKDFDYLGRAQVYLSLGQTAAQLGKTEEAVEAWQKCIAIDPNMAGAYFELAKRYLDGNNLPLSKQYLDKYAELAGPTAHGLWLGVRLERAFGNKDGEASKGLALQNLFPYSSENLEYQQWLGAD